MASFDIGVLYSLPPKVITPPGTASLTPAHDEIVWTLTGAGPGVNFSIEIEYDGDFKKYWGPPAVDVRHPNTWRAKRIGTGREDWALDYTATAGGVSAKGSVCKPSVAHAADLSGPFILISVTLGGPEKVSISKERLVLADDQAVPADPSPHDVRWDWKPLRDSLLGEGNPLQSIPTLAFTLDGKVYDGKGPFNGVRLDPPSFSTIASGRSTHGHFTYTITIDTAKPLFGLTGPFKFTVDPGIDHPPPPYSGGMSPGAGHGKGGDAGLSSGSSIGLPSPPAASGAPGHLSGSRRRRSRTSAVRSPGAGRSGR